MPLPKEDSYCTQPDIPFGPEDTDDSPNDRCYPHISRWADDWLGNLTPYLWDPYSEQSINDYPCSLTFRDFFEEQAGQDPPPVRRWPQGHEEACRRALEGLGEKRWQEDAGLRAWLNGGWPGGLERKAPPPPLSSGSPLREPRPPSQAKRRIKGTYL